MKRNMIAWAILFSFSFGMQIIIAVFLMHVVIDTSMETFGTITITFLIIVESFSLSRFFHFYFKTKHARELVMDRVFD